jgi:hypothetical protein
VGKILFEEMNDPEHSLDILGNGLHHSMNGKFEYRRQAFRSA